METKKIEEMDLDELKQAAEEYLKTAESYEKLYKVAKIRICIMEDEKFLDAVRVILQKGTVSASVLQSKFAIGYVRAVKLLDAMSSAKIISDEPNYRDRKILITEEDFEALIG